MAAGRSSRGMSWQSDGSAAAACDTAAAGWRMQGGPHNHQIAALAVALSTPPLMSSEATRSRWGGQCTCLAQSLVKRGFKLVSHDAASVVVLLLKS